MDNHVIEFFSQYSKETAKGNFHSVIALHDTPDINWETISSLDSDLTRGWFELCQLPIKDRIEFSLEFWFSKFSYNPNMDQALTAFFGALDDIGVFLCQKKFDDPYKAEMVYSFSNNRGFFRGKTNAKEKEILDLQKLFPSIILPKDYLAFLQIHNGFCKATDCTGIVGTFQMEELNKDLQDLIAKEGQVSTKSGKLVDPRALIPFYKSFGMPFYQCFWNEWHPELEMGNVYYSVADNSISDPLKKATASYEHMAFPKFTDWLVFYLEQIEV